MLIPLLVIAQIVTLVWFGSCVGRLLFIRSDLAVPDDESIRKSMRCAVKALALGLSSAVLLIVWVALL